MKITRGTLAEMIAVEVRRRLRELVETEEEGGDGKKKRKLSTADAADSPSPKGDVPAGPRATTGSPDASTPEIDQDEDPSGNAVDGDQPDPESGDDDEEAIDSQGEEGEDASGAINDEISGKTVQAITIEPQSKLDHASKEIVIAFNETTDALRILCTPTGQVKFFWRGQLHDLP